ncbi:ABC transporter permease subunit [Klebsiella pneumoniae]|uniref:ABC transporter permease subunit n=1 Tax=Klebsiella pneumoniae TaxID=573 RepID=A0A939STW9_KLEPN|nr:ABC transporter permease subunit [Klebsiella pneumoniae]
MVLLWQGAVSYFRIPAFLVPSPLVMLESLWTHLRRLAGAAVHPQDHPDLVSAVDCHRRRGGVYPVQNRFVETALFPYIVFLQVTPIVAIAPLIIIWVKDATLSLVVCATLMAVFPIIPPHSGTAQRLPRPAELFSLNHASRWQTLVRLRILGAAYFFGAAYFQWAVADWRGGGSLSPGPAGPIPGWPIRSYRPATSWISR